MSYHKDKMIEKEEENNKHAINLGYKDHEQMMGEIAYEQHMLQSGEHPDLQYQ